MAPEAKENDGENTVEQDDVAKKQQHIKDRLKEMGVASDSPRPQKSWISRNINFLIIAAVTVLVAAYVYEYQNSSVETADETIANKSADRSTDQPYVTSQNTVAPAVAYNQQPWQQQQQWQNDQWLEQQQRQQEEFRKRQEEAWQAQQQAFNQAKEQQQYWQQGYQYQPPTGYWPQYGAQYGYQQPGNNYPQQNNADNAINYNQQQPPAYWAPLPYYAQPYYNGGYR